MSTQLKPLQNAPVDISALDSGGNPAAVTDLTVDISDHAKAYAVLISTTHCVVVNRGPLGNYNLLINGKDADGNTVPTLTVPFQNVVGDATQFVAAVGSPASDDITTPALPVGW